MENINIILKELREISPVVASIGNRLPYTVPPAYFENLAVEIILKIAIEEKAGTDPLLNIPKDNLYQAPQGYFEQLAGSIMDRIKAEEAGNISGEPDFSSPLWEKIGKKNPFTLPAGYFSEFSDNVVAGVKAVEFVNEELENLSPTMSSLRDKQVYEIPGNYFAHTPAAILDKAKHQQPAKVIHIGFGKKFTRYAAAAAVITGIIVLGGYLYSGSKPVSIEAQIATETSKMPEQDIESFLNNNTISLADIGTDADTLNTATADTANAATIDAGANADDAKDLLADISDEELQQYLEQHGGTPNTFIN